MGPSSARYTSREGLFGSGDRLYAVSAQTGGVRRTVRLAGLISGLLADNQHPMDMPLRQRTLYVGAGPYLYALNPANGQIRWQRQLGGGATALPSLSPDGSTVFVDSSNGMLYALDTANQGRQLWSHMVGGLAQYQPSVANGMVYVGTGDSVYALDTTRQGQQAWVRTNLPGQVSGPVVAFGKVFVGSDRWLYCLNASTGQLCGQWPRPFRADGLVATPVLANGRVYAGTIGGHVYAVSVGTGTLIEP